MVEHGHLSTSLHTSLQSIFKTACKKVVFPKLITFSELAKLNSSLNLKYFMIRFF